MIAVLSYKRLCRQYALTKNAWLLVLHVHLCRPEKPANLNANASSLALRQSQYKLDSSWTKVPLVLTTVTPCLREQILDLLGDNPGLPTLVQVIIIIIIIIIYLP